MDEKFVGEDQPTPEVKVAGVGSLVFIDCIEKPEMSGLKYLIYPPDKEIEESRLMKSLKSMKNIQTVSTGTKVGEAIVDQKGDGNKVEYTTPGGEKRNIIIHGIREFPIEDLLWLDEKLNESPSIREADLTDIATPNVLWVWRDDKEEE